MASGNLKYGDIVMDRIHLMMPMAGGGVRFEKEGFETAIANDGKAAVQMFDSVNPDLMLLDIMLPELDGWQV